MRHGTRCAPLVVLLASRGEQSRLANEANTYYGTRWASALEDCAISSIRERFSGTMTLWI